MLFVVIIFDPLWSAFGFWFWSCFGCCCSGFYFITKICLILNCLTWNWVTTSTQAQTQTQTLGAKNWGKNWIENWGGDQSGDRSGNGGCAARKLHKLALKRFKDRTQLWPESRVSSLKTWSNRDERPFGICIQVCVHCCAGTAEGRQIGVMSRVFLYGGEHLNAQM